MIQVLKIKTSIPVLAFLLTMSPAHAAAPQPPPDVADRYQIRHELIGYPPLPPVRGLRRGDKDWLPTMRMAWAKHGVPMSAEYARRVARDMANLGFNVVISEDARYLLREPGEPAHSDEEATGAMPFPELVANTKQLVDACHAEGLRFIGHLTCAQVARISYARKHPDQAMIDIRTGKSIERENSGISYLCYVNPDFWNAYLGRVTEFIEKTALDGLMVDEIQHFYAAPHGCACASCRAALKAETGVELPPNGQPGDWFRPSNPKYQRWLKWKADQVARCQREIRDVLIRKRGPAAATWTYLCSSAYPIAFYTCSISTASFVDYADVMGNEVEPPGSQPYLYTYYWRNNVVDFKINQAIAAHRTGVTWGLFKNSFPHDAAWNSLLSHALGVKQWWAMNDPACTPSWQPMLAWEARHETLLANHQPLGNIGVAYSSLTQDHHPVAAGNFDYPFAFANLCKALMDCHMPFRVLLDRDLDTARFDGIDTLLLPALAMASDRAVENIRRFVHAGGTLVATGDCARFDENGVARENFALADALGVNFKGYRTDPKSRVEIESSPLPQPSIAPSVLSYGRDHCRIEVMDEKAKLLAHLVDGQGGRLPAIVSRSFGKGKAVYFAFRPEFKYASQFLAYGAPLVKPGEPWTDERDLKFGRLITDAALSGTPPPVCVENVPRGVFVEARIQRFDGAHNTVVTLANFLGAELTPGVVPLHLDPVFPEVKSRLLDLHRPITIRACAPEAKAVYLVSPDYERAVKLPFRRDGKETVVELPRLDRLAMIFFVHSSRDLIKELEGKSILDTQPEPVALVIRNVPPLAGEYDPNAAVAFVGHAPTFDGGLDYGRYKNEPARIAYGARSRNPQVKVALTLASIPKNARLTVGGMDDNAPTKAPIEILVNDKIVFKGDSQFPDNEWAARSFPIPEGALKAGANEVLLRNLGDSALDSMPPWVAVTFFKISSNFSHPLEGRAPQP